MTTLYRYETETYVNSLSLKLKEYIVIKETPCGYWVISKEFEHNIDNDEWVQRHKKWVSSTGTKRLCYPTREEAFRSFKARSRRRLSYAKRTLNLAEQAMRLAQENIEDHWEPAIYSIDSYRNY